MILQVIILLAGFAMLVKGADWFVEGAAGICVVPFESKFLIDTCVAIFSGVLLWLGTFRHKELRKPCGVVMLVCYAVYLIYLFIK